MKNITKLFKDALKGVTLLDIFPHTDYHKHISTPQEISNRAWQKTCNNFRKSVNKIGCEYNVGQP